MIDKNNSSFAIRVEHWYYTENSKAAGNSPVGRSKQESGAKHLEFELWDDADRSKIIFEELGIDIPDGEWQYDVLND